MKLVKVEAHGFKSFADKTVLQFDGGIVGIVGPNGSGKSNINDAIKWVLGEQSSKSLRGDTMEDIIFAGSKTVPAMKTAEVSLTFDNSEGRLSLPHKKIVITRRITRGGGGNNYFINGENARLKDIKEIAMESGISKSSLAIISQGTISDIAQATPDERRVFFEEAAGISKYKSRKKVSLRKLEQTTETLEKIQAVVRELERQVAPLKRQAEKAEKYLELTSELKGVEVALIVEDVSFYQEKLEELSEKYKEVIETKEELNAQIVNATQTVKDKTAFKLTLENEILSLDQRLQALSDQVRDIESRDAATAQRRQLIIEGQIQSSDASKKIAMKEELEELAKKISSYTNFIDQSQENINSRKVNASESDISLSRLKFQKEQIQTQIYRVKSKIDMLEDNKKNRSNLFKGTKTIINNQSAFSGVKGIVADIINVEEKYSSAIETVLQNALQNVVVDSSDTAVQCVNFLKQNQGGRATFIPLSSVKPKFIREDHKLALTTQPGFVGIGSDLIKTAPQFELLKKFLLGNIIVTENVEQATSISNLLERRYAVVSLDGNIVRVGGVISGGQQGNSRDLLNIDEQITKLRESDEPLLQKKIEEINSKIAQFDHESSEERAFVGELYIEIAKTKEKLSISKDQYEFLLDKYESSTKEKFEASTKVVPENSKENLILEKSNLSASLKAKREKVLSINNDLSDASNIKSELEKTLMQVIESSADTMTKRNQADFYVSSSMKRLSEEYQMTIEAATEKFSLEMDREEAREIVAEKRKLISELGHVNLDSIEDYAKVSERYEKLQASEEEIFNAQQTILAAINKMDKIIITKLDEMISSTRDEFQKVFETMFGGGVAKIKYTDPDNLLETGIEIVAQPPGKSVRNLKLFSGGEKAIIAISLLFAMLKSKPLPLCILDEVEAALDEANVLRYAHFLQTLKDTTQFIVVTHRVGTMENVDRLFGATMQQRGVTSFFTVKLDVAKEIINI